MKYFKLFTKLFITLFLINTVTGVSAKTFTIIHTNDMHSHLLGFSPNIDYTPKITGNDKTLGGWARTTTLIKDVKKRRKNPVLVLDAGDFLMGSLFHMISREEAAELHLMQKMGYDAVALGNHEFDLKPSNLAKILTTAHNKKAMPNVLLSNAIFSKESKKDDSLEDVFKKNILKSYVVLEREGVRIGIFSVIGKSASGVAPYANPVKFEDIAVSAKKMVKLLREQEKAEMIICLSHSGLWEHKILAKDMLRFTDVDRPERDELYEDEDLAKKVNGIDIIISGHTHTKAEKPVIINDTIIVQSGSYSKYVGLLDFTFINKKVKLKEYKLVNIDDSIKGDLEIIGLTNLYVDKVNINVLNPVDFSFFQTIAKTDFDLVIEQDESNLGNLITDSIRWSVNKYDSDPKDPTTRVDIAVESYGLIRDSVLKGETGKIAVCDLFRALPLGIGADDTMGYPIVSCYFTAEEIKKCLEVITTVYPLEGSDYFLQISGVKFTYNPNRVMFDRVTGIWLGDDKKGYTVLDYSGSNKKLYRVAANLYNTTFLKVIGDFTMDILTIVPKDKNGKPIEDLDNFRVDIDKNKEGIQELKEWVGMLEYVQSFQDTDGDGITDIPGKYKDKLGRIVSQPSWSPVALLSGGNWLTWSAFFIIVIVCPLLLIMLYKLTRRIFRKIRG
ncbi:MAG: hypothetical protein GY754_02210 [bacterium]|nr:hypothetical protein [bacterium]